MQIKETIEKVLLNSTEPTVRLKTYLRLLEYEYDTPEVRKITNTLKKSSTVISQLFSYLPKEEDAIKLNVYKKWEGVHWILADLADIGYPPEDSALIPSRNYELMWLFNKARWSKKRTLMGRKRFCASQEGNGLFSIIKLGLDDGRCMHLAERLIKYQWEDGGWNCDTKPEAKNSSYHESLIPLRALNAYVQISKSKKTLRAIDNAAEVFLKRKLCWKLRTDEVIHPQWIKLHYPPYWRYDILIALKVMAEVGKIHDPRCQDALDLLESKWLPDGGFPVEERYYQSSRRGNANYSPVDWGGVNKRKMNEWVTIDAFHVLKEANRIDIEM